MTRAAQAFITPLTLQALSDNPVHTDLFDPDREAAMGHIELARWADAVVIAPATADLLARLAHGLADDLLTTLCLATESPILAAPAMNRVMWSNPATRENVALLRERGMCMAGPEEGYQACGETGAGRMAEPKQIVAALQSMLADGPLVGVPVLVTAGPTREPIDPVRYVSNRSSGKMGYAVARAARDAGAHVTLVSGPVSLEPPTGVERVAIESAAQMCDAVLERVTGCAIYIGVAAVSDYRPHHVAERKIKKSHEALSLTLERTRDILATVSALPNPPFTVGFAAETNDVERYAHGKLVAKGLDMIAANLVDAEVGGFEDERNALVILWQGGRIELPLADKEKLARELIYLIATRYRNTHKRATDDEHP
jgi:phosphopantothenoylcysteine decarboxylase/phosphopantothenate--cysteine ligase